jgi:uncharacterized membrane protein YbhN (UPF0104 family)/tRNA A-37 threonylcarbamoyl transferase component Bud32
MADRTPQVPGNTVVDEPAQPRRIRRPGDAARFGFGLLLLVLLLVFTALAFGTTSGFEYDLRRIGGLVSSPIVGLLSVAASIAVVAIPIGLAAERLVKREASRVADAVVTAALAYLFANGLNLWVAKSAPASLAAVLLRQSPDHVTTDAIHVYLAAVVAYVTVVGLDHRPQWQAAVWLAVAGDGAALLFGGHITPVALVSTLLLGRTIAFGARYALGATNVRPPGSAVAAGLLRIGLKPERLTRITDGPDDSRRYEARIDDGRILNVVVLDRDVQAAGSLYRFYRRIRLRSFTQRRTVLSLRRILDHSALMAYALPAAGVSTPKLVGALELGPDAAMLAFEQVAGRPFGALAPEEIDDELLAKVWRQLRLLHAGAIAHRRLGGENILIGADGAVSLLDLRSAEIAASELMMRLDTAQLLTTVALGVGPRRAVASAQAALDLETVAHALPLVQRVAMLRATRQQLRAHPQLLTELREQVLAAEPGVSVEPIRLERFRLRTLLTAIASAAAAYLLLSQLTHVNFGQLVRDAKWGWAALAVGASVLTYAAAAMSLMGFVPERLSWPRTLLAQVAAGFVTLVAPAAVGGAAVNTRYLQRNQVPPGQAVASVGVAQAIGLISHIGLLLAFGYVTGTEQPSDAAPSATAITVVLVVAIAVLVVLAVPPLRRLVVARLRQPFAGVVPRLLDVLQKPTKLATGLGGTLLLSLAYILCLSASIHAFGGSMSVATVAVVFLAGNALGSLVPTPGGLGAVEAALSAGLSAAGLAGQTAVSAVLLFRLVTFWLPVLPGWVAFTYLRRRQAL